MKIIRILLFILIMGFIIVFYQNIFSSNQLIETLVFNKNYGEGTIKEINRLVSLKTFSFQDTKDIKETGEVINTFVNIEAPLVYIYNTHDKEQYSSENNFSNLDATVVTASYLLQDQLKLYGINSIVEERSPVQAIKKENLEYLYTYSFSRTYLKEAIEKYPSLLYFIDLHRDGVNKNVSTTIIDGKSYAKLMFFLGTNHEYYEQNLNLVESLKTYLEENYTGILRKTFYREDPYNQDLMPNSFLIEVGGNYNNLDEVYNSAVALAKAIAFNINKGNKDYE